MIHLVDSYLVKVNCRHHQTCWQPAKTNFVLQELSDFCFQGFKIMIKRERERDSKQVFIIAGRSWERGLCRRFQFHILPEVLLFWGKSEANFILDHSFKLTNVSTGTTLLSHCYFTPFTPFKMCICMYMIRCITLAYTPTSCKIWCELESTHSLEQKFSSLKRI